MLLYLYIEIYIEIFICIFWISFTKYLNYPNNNTSSFYLILLFTFILSHFFTIIYILLFFIWSEDFSNSLIHFPFKPQIIKNYFK